MTTENDKIKAMLARFYAGETTESEETALADFFATHEVSADLEADRLLFARMFGATAANVPEGLEQRLENAIDSMAADDAAHRKGLRLWLRRYVAAAAATVMLCAIAGVAVYKIGGGADNLPTAATEAPRDTYDNPEQAAKATEMALMKFSETMNKGLKAL